MSAGWRTACTTQARGMSSAMCPTSQALLSALSTSQVALRRSAGILERMAARYRRRSWPRCASPTVPFLAGRDRQRQG